MVLAFNDLAEMQECEKCVLDNICLAEIHIPLLKPEAFRRCMVAGSRLSTGFQGFGYVHKNPVLRSSITDES